LEWRKDSTAQIVFEFLKSQKNGSTIAAAAAKLEGTFETTNCPNRIATVWQTAVIRGIAIYDKASKVYKATKTS